MKTDAEILRCLQENEGAVRLYERLGFHEAARLPGFFKMHGKNYDTMWMIHEER